VGVVETRNHRQAAQVDHLRRLAAGHLVVDADDTTMPDADGGGVGVPRLHRVHVGVVEQEVQHETHALSSWCPDTGSVATSLTKPPTSTKVAGSPWWG